jgi:asparagine synthase (glutamine-hydrolysing)
MCGIAGELNLNENLTVLNCENSSDVIKSLKRRGPDQDGVYFSDSAAMLHTRLCVIDIEKGRQPMIKKDGIREFAIVYNGELYNTQEIRDELLAKGYTFEGHSDTEVLISSYIEWGEKCVERVNGIFAFAIWEKHNRRLFIARDRIGVKPFFYAISGKTFLFASEIKALLSHPSIKPEIDIHSIAEIMLVGPGRTPGYGVFRGIEELRPACCGYFSQEGLKTWRYWKLEDKEHTDNFEQTVERVRFLVTDSIERQLVSDVPVCTMLSGGLDSSIISSVADRYMTKMGEQLHTFSVSYRDNEKYFKKSKFQPNSDDEYIGIMNEYLHAQNHRIVLDTPELVNALYSAVDARDLPGMADVDASMLLFCGAIKEHATVALSGECADEIFGGYPWYRDKNIRESEGFPWAQSTGYRAGFLKDEFAYQIDAYKYVDDLYRETISNTSKREGLSKAESRMKEMVDLNLSWFMQTLLDRKDRMSMYNGLEVRVPFCDYRIAQYLYSVPWEFKDYNHYEKGLLRKAVEGLLPEQVLWRKKSPYPKTHNPAYLKAVGDILSGIIKDPGSPLLQIVKKEELQKLLTAENPTPWYGQLMTTAQTIAYFIQINYWLEKYKIRIV